MDGVRRILHQDPRVGQKVVWWGVNSCSPTKSVAMKFAGSYGARSLFVVTTRCGTNIKAFSSYPNEDEVVLAPGIQLEVYAVEKKAGKLTEVYLREQDGVQSLVT